MADLTSFQVTDDVTDNLAEYHNRLLGGVIRAEFVNTETISATKELTDVDCQYQVLTAGSTDQIVELAPEASTNHLTLVYNTTPSSDNYNVIVKDDSGTTTFVTLRVDEWGLLMPVSGESWVLIARGGSRSGQSTLTSDFSITGATTVFQDTGLSVTLPEAGTYLLLADVRYRLTGNAGTSWAIEAKLYNSTDTADVANSLRRVSYTAVTAVALHGTCPISVLATVTASKVIKLYAARTSDGTFTLSDVAGSTTFGLTSLSYVKITA